MIIGIAGYKGSGKDTAGSVLIDKYGFEKISFAAPMKDLVAQMFNIDRFMLEGSDCKMRALREDPKFGAYGMSGRKLLQEIGTGLRDIVSPNIWVDMALKNCIDDENYVITDVRFPNEVEAIHNKGGFVIGIKRPGFNGDGHISEHSLDDIALPYIINNDESIDILKVKMDTLINARLNIGIKNEIAI